MTNHNTTTVSTARKLAAIHDAWRFLQSLYYGLSTTNALGVIDVQAGSTAAGDPSAVMVVTAELFEVLRRRGAPAAPTINPASVSAINPAHTPMSRKASPWRTVTVDHVTVMTKKGDAP